MPGNKGLVIEADDVRFERYRDSLLKREEVTGIIRLKDARLAHSRISTDPAISVVSIGGVELDRAQALNSLGSLNGAAQR